MAMGKNAITGIGALVAVGLLAGAYFGVAAPLIAINSTTETELAAAEQIGDALTNKLARFAGGENDETRKATQTMDEFNGYVSETLDIESASRAIAASLPAGVKLDSFNFGAAQPVSTLGDAPVSIGTFTPPSDFGGGASAGGGAQDTGTEAVDPTAPLSGFNRVPYTIKVSANSYGELADYLNSLSQQPRLMSVVSVDSSRAEGVAATIYAYAFAGR